MTTRIVYKDVEYDTITERSATVLYPIPNETTTQSSSKSSSKSSSSKIESVQSVFYNPAQETNRDLSVLVLQSFANLLKEEHEQKCKRPWEAASPLCIAEALSATGLRSVRYAKEVEDIDVIYANDIDKEAVRRIECNIEYNKVENKVVAHQGNAIQWLAGGSREFDVVDLDPYGTPAPFLFPSVSCVKDGGLLMVTATDMSVLCGNYPEVCWGLYGGCGVRGIGAVHEFALRLLLGSLAHQAATMKKSLVPLLSLSIDFYVRVFVRIVNKPRESKLHFIQSGMVYQCSQCDTYQVHKMGKKMREGKFIVHGSHVPTQCPTCDGTWRVTGPVWLGPLHTPTFVDRIITTLQPQLDAFTTSKRLLGMLSVVKEEIDAPLYYVIDRVCNTLRITTPKGELIRAALLHAGFRVSGTHAHPNAIKTNAPGEIVFEIFRVWAEKHAPGKTPKKDTPAARIMAKNVTGEYNFAWTDGALAESKKKRMVRYPPNPTKDWGPAKRAKHN